MKNLCYKKINSHIYSEIMPYVDFKLNSNLFIAFRSVRDSTRGIKNFSGLNTIITNVKNRLS